MGSWLTTCTTATGVLLLTLLIVRTGVTLAAHVGGVDVIVEYSSGGAPVLSFSYEIATPGTLVNALLLAAMPPVLLQTASWRAGSSDTFADGPRVAAVGCLLVAAMSSTFEWLAYSSHLPKVVHARNGIVSTTFSP